MSNYKWPLNDIQFTIVDRIKLASFFLNPQNRWTQGELVEKLEKKISDYIGVKNSVFVSSGSTANTILAYWLKDTIDPKRKIVVFPSVTWQTSCAPFIREGFTPHFIDISIGDFCLDIVKLEEFLSKNADKVAAVFPTSLIGFTPDVLAYKTLCSRYNVKLMFDNCENTLGSQEIEGKEKNLCSIVTSTTSSYIGHYLNSVEGGFIFTDSDEEADLFRMYRNHGMTRGAKDPKRYNNPDVDSRFDFYLLGNNFRNSDVNALIGGLDIERLDSYKEHRILSHLVFSNNIDRNRYYLPYKRADIQDVPFCLPIIFTGKEDKSELIISIEEHGIETRPIISGNLLRQTCYKKYGNYKNFPIAEMLHLKGFYVGIHNKVSEEMIVDLTKILNNF